MPTLSLAKIWLKVLKITYKVPNTLIWLRVTRTFIVRNVRRRHNASNRRLNTCVCRTHSHNTSSSFHCCRSTDARHEKADKDVGVQARQAYADWPEVSRGVAGIVPTARQRKMSTNGLKQNLLQYHSTKTAKIFWVTLDGATHGASISCPMHSYIKGYPIDFCCFSRGISSHRPYNEF